MTEIKSTYPLLAGPHSASPFRWPFRFDRIVRVSALLLSFKVQKTPEPISRLIFGAFLPYLRYAASNERIVNHVCSLWLSFSLQRASFWTIHYLIVMKTSERVSAKETDPHRTPRAFVAAQSEWDIRKMGRMHEKENSMNICNNCSIRRILVWLWLPYAIQMNQEKYNRAAIHATQSAIPRRPRVKWMKLGKAKGICESTWQRRSF